MLYAEVESLGSSLEVELPAATRPAELGCQLPRGARSLVDKSAAIDELARHAACLSFYPGALRADDGCCASHFAALSTQPR